eukprot:jgi/Bigna1/76431/fgenesh1_pg.41_\
MSSRRRRRRLADCGRRANLLLFFGFQRKTGIFQSGSRPKLSGKIGSIQTFDLKMNWETQKEAISRQISGEANARCSSEQHINCESEQENSLAEQNRTCTSACTMGAACRTPNSAKPSLGDEVESKSKLPVQAKDVLNFWFGGSTRDNIRHKWFTHNGSARQKELDRTIHHQFGSMLECALRGGFMEWTQTPKGTLALVVLLDQFSRHVFRGGKSKSKMRACDAHAYRYATAFVNNGGLPGLALPEQCFMLLPLRHKGNKKDLINIMGMIDDLDGEFTEHQDLLKRFRRATVRSLQGAKTEDGDPDDILEREDTESTSDCTTVHNEPLMRTLEAFLAERIVSLQMEEDYGGKEQKGRGDMSSALPMTLCPIKDGTEKEDEGEGGDATGRRKERSPQDEKPTADDKEDEAARNKRPCVCVSLSGGVDSMVIAFLLVVSSAAFCFEKNTFHEGLLPRSLAAGIYLFFILSQALHRTYTYRLTLIATYDLAKVHLRNRLMFEEKERQTAELEMKRKPSYGGSKSLKRRLSCPPPQQSGIKAMSKMTSTGVKKKKQKRKSTPRFFSSFSSSSSSNSAAAAGGGGDKQSQPSQQQEAGSTEGHKKAKGWKARRNKNVRPKSGFNSQNRGGVPSLPVFDIAAVHVNYGNRKESESELVLSAFVCKVEEKALGEYTVDDMTKDAMALFVANWCSERGVQIRVRTITEAKRGAAMKKTGAKGVIFGHHKGDIEENVISNMMKGVSLLQFFRQLISFHFICPWFDKLSGMGEESVKDGVTIWRPFLPHRKSEIYTVAHRYGVPYFKDTTPEWSNRGRMRNKLMPLLADIFGDGFRHNLANLAAQSDEFRNLTGRTVYEPFLKSLQKTSVAVWFECGPYIDHPMAFWKEALRMVMEKEIGVGRIGEKPLSMLLESLSRASAPAGKRPKKDGFLPLRNNVKTYLRGTTLVVFRPSFFTDNRGNIKEQISNKDRRNEKNRGVHSKSSVSLPQLHVEDGTRVCLGVHQWGPWSVCISECSLPSSEKETATASPSTATSASAITAGAIASSSSFEKENKQHGETKKRRRNKVTFDEVLSGAFEYVIPLTKSSLGILKRESARGEGGGEAGGAAKNATDSSSTTKSRIRRRSSIGSVGSSSKLSPRRSLSYLEVNRTVKIKPLMGVLADNVLYK